MENDVQFQRLPTNATISRGEISATARFLWNRTLWFSPFHQRLKYSSFKPYASECGFFNVILTPPKLNVDSKNDELETVSLDSNMANFGVSLLNFTAASPVSLSTCFCSKILMSKFFWLWFLEPNYSGFLKKNPGHEPSLSLNNPLMTPYFLGFSVALRGVLALRFPSLVWISHQALANFGVGRPDLERVEVRQTPLVCVCRLKMWLPKKLTWKLKLVFFSRWLSFCKGWFLGSMLIWGAVPVYFKMRKGW